MNTLSGGPKGRGRGAPRLSSSPFCIVSLSSRLLSISFLPFFPLFVISVPLFRSVVPLSFRFTLFQTRKARTRPPSAPRRASAPGRQATLRRAAADAPARLRRTRKRFRAIR
ncbi:hypothetical protein CUC46_24520 (plasmid) [Citrobacter freundii]|nr:hypothetical protein CUC46_24520 [Citrobacter freundii]